MKDWLARRPLRWNTTTLHVERTSFDQRLFEIARNQGVAFKWDRVVGVEREGTRLLSCRTADGSELRSSWFVDGSGRTRVLARKLGVEFESYGPHKVSLWAYFTTPPAREATTIYGDAREPYLTWVWEIPVSPTLTSVGCVIAAAELKRRCQSGSKVDDVFRQELARYERFQLLLHETNAPEGAALRAPELHLPQRVRAELGSGGRSGCAAGPSDVERRDSRLAPCERRCPSDRPG